MNEVKRESVAERAKRWRIFQVRGESNSGAHETWPCLAPECRVGKSEENLIVLQGWTAAATAYTRALALRPNLMMVRYNLARVRFQGAYAILSNIGRRPKGETDLGARAGFAAWGCGAACGPRARAEHQVRSGA